MEKQKHSAIYNQPHGSRGRTSIEPFNLIEQQKMQFFSAAFKNGLTTG